MDVSAKPRVKDAKGRYSCEPCHAKGEAKQRADAQRSPGAPAATRTPAPAASAPATSAPATSADEGEVDLGLLRAIESTGTVVSNPCENCGISIPADAAVCISCGYNRATGRTLTTTVVAVKDDTPKEPTKMGNAARALGRQGAFVGIPLMWVVGGLIGGAIGAAIWAGGMPELFREDSLGRLRFSRAVKIFPLITCALAGFGVMIAATRTSSNGPYAAIVAVVIALGACFAGRTMAMDAVAKRLEARWGEITQEDREHLAYAFATADEARAQQMAFRWPRPEGYHGANSLDDFPKEIIAEAMGRWEEATPEDRAKVFEPRAILVDNSIKDDKQELREDLGMVTLRPSELIMLVIGLGIAVKLAYNGLET